MHIGYLVLAVRNLLREKLCEASFPERPFAEAEIEVSPGGRPMSWSGERFIGVYGSNWSPAQADSNIGLDAYLGVSCTLTYRSPAIPQRKTGPHLYADLQRGMAAVCWEIAKVVSMTSGSTTDVPLYTKLEELDGYEQYSIFEYLRWMGTDPEPVPQYADWFSAKNEHLLDPMGTSIMGYSMTVRFGQARGGYRYR